MAAEYSADHRVDLLLAALLLFYLDAVLDERLARSWRCALGAGALGGATYLAKLYALPFFAVHYSLVVLARGWASRARSAEKGVPRLSGSLALPAAASPGPVRAPEATLGGRGSRRAVALVRRWAALWAVGLAGFAVVAAPWVEVLSAKYGRLTFGTAAAQTYAQFGPGSGNARWQAITGLRTPPAGAYSIWQDAAFDFPAAPGRTSPFRSWAALREQLRVTSHNLRDILAHLSSLDQFHLGLIALALTLPAFLATLRRRETAFRHLVVALTVGTFCGGYAFVHAEDERFFWFIFFVAAVVALHFVGAVPRILGRLTPRIRGPQIRFVTLAAGLLAVFSFGSRPVAFLGQLFRAAPPGREHRLVAKVLAEWGVGGPLAATNWHDGLHTAYYLNAQYAGMPAAEDPAGIAAEMRATCAVTLLVWGEPRLAALLRADPRFVPVGTIPARSLTGLRDDVAVFSLSKKP
jgi:hypothetical protein